MSRTALVPAPKRGHYDRSLTRRDRQLEQRERLLAATIAVASSDRELNVGNVVALAGVGRNTFYEYFDDIEHAVNAVRARARHDLDNRITVALGSSRAPFERMRALTRAWCECVQADVPRTKLILNRGSQADATGLSSLGQDFRRALAEEAFSRSALPGLGDERRVIALIAGFEALTRAALADDFGRDLPSVLADLALRVLR